MRYLKENNEYKRVSRYQALRVIESLTSTYLETFNQVPVPESSGDSYHVVSPDEVNRLDIISYNFYGSSSYWWAIALANNLIDPFVINEGVMLRIPSLATLSNPSNNILVR